MEEFQFYNEQHENETIENYLSLSIINYGLSQHKGDVPQKLFCACKNAHEKILGAVMGTKTLNLFFITHIYVEEIHRKKGIGGQLLIEIEKKAREFGCNLIRLNTFNNLSHSFYLKNGFNQTVIIPNYMSGFDLVYYDKNIS